MNTVKIVDYLFSHAQYSTDFQKSKYIKWNRQINPTNDLVIFTDTALDKVDFIKARTKIAWLVESPEITKYNYHWIRNNYNKFDYIFTFDKSLLDISDKFLLTPIGGCWIKPEDQKIYEKTKNISIIASHKNSTYGHNLRHQIIKKYNNIDVYGRIYNPIDYKLTALKDYKYTMCIENIKTDYYFTEKLIDCFMTGTIPIYYGCPSIKDFFDIEGIILIDKLNDLDNIINNLDENLYNSKIEHIKNNFELAKKYLICEDYIYLNHLKNKI